MHGLEPTFDHTLAGNLPGAHGIGEAFEARRAEIREGEEIAD